MSTLWIFLEIYNDEEKSYIERYQSFVLERCDHLLSEADGILSIKL